MRMPDLYGISDFMEREKRQAFSVENLACRSGHTVTEPKKTSYRAATTLISFACPKPTRIPRTIDPDPVDRPGACKRHTVFTGRGFG
jgi:hypothetical protein